MLLKLPASSPQHFRFRVIIHFVFSKTVHSLSSPHSSQTIHLEAMGSSMKFVFGLLTLVTIGMIIGALFQLAYIRKMEESSESSPLQVQRIGQLQFNSLIFGDGNSSNFAGLYVPTRNGPLHISTSGQKSASIHIPPLDLVPLGCAWQQERGAGFPSLRRTLGSQNDVYNRFPGGAPGWADDKDAEVLRLGFVKPEVISWAPRIIVLHNFLGMEECDHLKAIAKPRLSISTVVDKETGKGVQSRVRTSSGMFLNSAERKHPIVQAIEKRISVYSQVPPENGELLQVLRYEKDQFYRPHHDYFSETFNVKRGGQRIATMLMYLNDNVEGGETIFPKAGTGECQCGNYTRRGISVKPIKGNAVLFWSMGLDGQSDPNSIHGGCEVLAGEKWSATKWMRQRHTS